MKKLNKKAFTIVELIVVIVIIGILAAILIPNVVKYIDQTKVIKDKELVSNLNSALTKDTLVNGKHQTMHSAVVAGRGEGLDVTKIQTKYEILWDSKNDVFCYLEDGALVYIPESVKEENRLDINNPADKIQLFKMYTSYVDEGYSIYWNSNGAFTNPLVVGFDAGDSTGVTALNYVTDSSYPVIIRTNSSSTSLTIDAINSTVYHYDSLGSLNIIKSAPLSYHEFGKTAFAEIAKGRIVLEEDSNIEQIHINKKDANSFDEVIIRNNGAEKLPSKITRDAIAVESEKEKVVVVEMGTVSETVYVYASSETGSTQKITEGENKQNEAVNSDLGQLVLDNGTKSNALTEDQQKEAKDEKVLEAQAKETVSDLKDMIYWEQCIEGVTLTGIGTELNPYKISSPMQLALVSHNVNNVVEPNDGCVAYDVAYYELLTNIDLSGKSWTPIGNVQDIQFGGKIDGKNHKIIGLDNGKYIGEITENSYTGHIGVTYGLIGFTKGEVILQNIIMEDVNINYENAKVCGVLVGDTGSKKTGNDGTDAITKKLHIINCHVAGNVKGYDKVAGLVGYLINVPDIKVEQCSVSGSLSLTDYGSTKGYRAGGLFGYFSLTKNSTDEYKDLVINDCTVSATLSKGDSSSTKFWLGAIVSGSNANCNMVITNFKFTGEIIGQNLIGQVSNKKDNNLGSVYTEYADLLDVNGNCIIGYVGQAGEIWWTRIAGGVRSISPSSVVNAIVGENRDYLYHLTTPAANVDGSYSFTFSGESCITNFDNPAANINVGSVKVNCSTGAITDNNNLLTSGHTVISETYTYYDLLLEVLQNHFISENE